jgi:uncharacterized membrane protein YfhO
MLTGQGTAPSTASLSSLPAVRPVAVRLAEYQPRRLAFAVTCPEAGWLWVTDRWARGWRATVDGRSVDVLGANFLFRAVPVAAGVNHVVFEYEPFGHPWLLLLSWGTMALVLLLTLRSGTASSPT